MQAKDRTICRLGTLSLLGLSNGLEKGFTHDSLTGNSPTLCNGSDAQESGQAIQFPRSLGRKDGRNQGGMAQVVWPDVGSAMRELRRRCSEIAGEGDTIMPHHFTKGTVEAAIFCPRCMRETMWRIADGRRQYCLKCNEKPKPSVEVKVEKSGDLFS